MIPCFLCELHKAVNTSLNHELHCATLALGADPTKAEASGMSKNALRSLGIGVDKLDSNERAHRMALAKRVLAKVKPLKAFGEIELLPGLGPHAGSPAGEQLVLTIPDKTLTSVSEKIVRGCE